MADPGSPPPKDAKTKAAEAKIRVEVAQAAARRAEARAEYDESTRSLFFTKDFNDSLEAIMHDRLAAVGDRILAWAKRWAWGEYSLYAIGVDGWPKYQVDCCSELGLEKQRVSKVVGYLQKRGYLAPEPKRIVPVISPEVGGPPPEEGSQEHQLFMAEWKVAHSADWEREVVLVSELKGVRQVRLSEYKKWKASRTSAGASLLEIARDMPKTEPQPAGVRLTPFEQSNLQHQIGQAPPAQKPNEGKKQAKRHSEQAIADVIAEIAGIQNEYPDSLFAKPRIDEDRRSDRAVVNQILDALASDEDDEIRAYFLYVDQVKFKGRGSKNKPRPPGSSTGPDKIGWLVGVAKEFAALSKEQRAKTAGAGAGGSGESVTAQKLREQLERRKPTLPGGK